MLNIEGAVAVITGGSGGIGMALAQTWINRGGRAVIADINKEALARAKEVLGDQAETFVCNVTYGRGQRRPGGLCHREDGSHQPGSALCRHHQGRHDGFT